jgi:hypothetical protein
LSAKPLQQQLSDAVEIAQRGRDVAAATQHEVARDSTRCNSNSSVLLRDLSYITTLLLQQFMAESLQPQVCAVA